METSEKDPFSQHSLVTMDKLKRNQTHSDAVIEAGGRKFKIHKCIFAIYSDYFDKVFTVEMQEKYNNAVTLENTGADVMECIVDFIYTGKLDIDRQNAVEILVAADYLRIEKIIEIGTEYLLENTDVENCLSSWLYASTYDVKDLAQKCLSIFGENLMSVAQTREMEQLESDEFLLIVESSKEMRKSEEHFLSAATIWAKFDLNRRKHTFQKIFETYDITKLSTELLSNLANEPLGLLSEFMMNKMMLELISRLSGVQGNLLEASTVIAKMEKENHFLERKACNLIKENKRLANVLRKTKREEEKLHYRCLQSTSQIKELSEEIKQLNVENERLEGENKAPPILLDDLQQRIEKLVHENKILLSKHLAINQSYETSLKLIEKREATIGQLESRIRNLTQQNTFVKKRLDCELAEQFHRNLLNAPVVHDLRSNVENVLHAVNDEKKLPPFGEVSISARKINSFSMKS